MKKGKGSQVKKKDFTPQELKQLTDLFAILIQIDRREKATKAYAAPLN